MSNIMTITLGGTEYKLMASNRAAKVYADEFYGKSPEGFTAVLKYDTQKLYLECLTEDDDGVLGVNLDSSPILSEVLWRIIWALAYAGGSVDVGYEQWLSDHEDEAWSAMEEMEAYVGAIDLVTANFFRESKEQGRRGPKSD